MAKERNTQRKGLVTGVSSRWINMGYCERLRGGRFVTGKNVRRDTDDHAVWREARLPKVVRDDGWVPTGSTVLAGAPGKMAVWFSKGNVIGYALCDSGSILDVACEVRTLGILNGELVHVADLKDGVVRMIVKGCRAVYATYDRYGVMTLCGEMPQLPWLRFVRLEERNLSIGIGSVALSGKSDPHGSVLSEEDAAVVSSALKGAYGKLRSRANGSGMFLQPVIARYRLLDGAGGTVVVSPPVMVGASGGVQCTDEFSMTSTDGLASLSAGRIYGNAFSLVLRGMESVVAPWNGVIKRLVVELCGELDVVDEAAECMSRVSNDGREVTVNVTLPTGNEDVRRKKVLSKLVSHENFEEHLVVEDPFGAACVSEVKVPVFPVLKSVTRPYAAGRNPLRDAVTFDFVGEAGGWTVACGKSEELFSGFPAACFSTVDGSGSWKALIETKVARADGSVQSFVNVCSGDGDAPAELSPLLVFPDANAREMTLNMESGGKIQSETYRLTSLPDAGCACFVGDGCRGIMPRGVISSMPSHPENVAGTVEHAGYVGMFSDATMCQELGSMTFDSGTVVAAVSAPSNGGSWDFSRVRLLLFGSGGINVATIDGNGRFHSLAPLDDRPVKGIRGVCRVSGPKGLTHYVIAGDDLLEVSRSGIKTLLVHCRAESVGWCGRRNELWLSGGGRPLRRVDPRWPQEEIEVSGAVVGESPLLLQWGARQLVVSEEGYVCDVAQESDSPVEAAIALRYETSVGGSDGRGIVNLLLDVCAARYHGTIGVYGDNGTALPELLCSYKVNGAINMPAPMRLVAPRRRFVELHVAGEVAELAIRN